MQCYIWFYMLCDVSAGHIILHIVVFDVEPPKEKVWKHKLFNSAKQGQGQYISRESIISKFTK